ncbi:hypothetical protein [Hydrogenibacillus sp. N12]|nr:hypothetical protein [Hydrogenibacillus sp. N12]
MAILPQGSLFSWNEIAGLGDLERLKRDLEWLGGRVAFVPPE